MKFTLGLLSLLSVVDAECVSSKDFPINDATKLSFEGFLPTVKRTLNTGVGNKIVLTGFSKDPVVTEDSTGNIRVVAGDDCDPEVTGPGADVPGETPDAGDVPGDNTGDKDTGSSATSRYLGFAGLAGLVGASGKNALVGSTLALALGTGFLASPVAAQDQSVTECLLVPIEVEIFADISADLIVQEEFKTGEFEACPPETMYWEHHPDVFGGYTGCVAERGLYPCASDALGVDTEGGEFYKQSPVYWDAESMSCVDTDYTMADRTFWILWGHPMDKHELNARSGLNPVVSFPFNRMPYSLYARGQDPTSSQDDSNDARIMAKELLEYIGAWTVEELADWSVTITEGAEQGMVHLFAAKAMEIASTTCNRDIQVLMQAPAYGYSTGDAANIANRFTRDFYNSSECECFATDSCKDPTVTISVNGWLPNTPFPTALGGDGIEYPANSASPNSPWFESMVFPENPSGVIKVGQIPDPNRRVCDGVYLWPMYLGARDYAIPKDELPDCSAWSFSISKIYSAAARAGWIMYKQDPVTNHEAMVDAIGTSQSLTHGSLSEWTWHGQLQLFETFMSKPLDDPTSWIGAYTSIMKDKWAAIKDGFSDCPIVQPSNPDSGAYVWFVFQPEYIGIQTSSTPSFFRDVLGVQATTYSWGFRGATPSDFYGEGYSGNDFTRLQLYRDVEVYEEVARRAKIVCNDFTQSIGDNLISVEQWIAAETGTAGRRRLQGYDSVEERHRHLKEIVPSLTDRQLRHVVETQLEGERTDAAINACAPEYTTHCLFENIGVHGEDNF